ncbi:3-oxoacyl-[acyl-carrier-protein] synthase III C-terminal domain-containing protein [Algivirga pacifica]
MPKNFSIKGVGKYLPKNCLESHEIEAELGLPSQWYAQRVGVETRYRVTDETCTQMGVEALREALSDAQMEISDLDGIIAASATFDYVIPNRSTLIKEAFFEAETLDFPCFDINTVCTSFITALDYASTLLQGEEYQNIAIVSSEIASHGLSSNRPETYGLFGDAAAAVIVSKSSTGENLRYMQKTYSEGVRSTIIRGGGNAYHPKNNPYEMDLYSFDMAGTHLLRIVNKYIYDYMDRFFEKTSTHLSEVDWIVPHQTSLFGMNLLTKINRGKSDNIINQLSVYGNCVAASIPLTLVNSIKEGVIKEGDRCLLLGTAAGVSICGLLLNYSKS